MDKDYLSLHLNEILACLRAQYLSYQTSHWQSSGPSAYQDHLLYERLYKSVEEQIDTLAEKLSGLTDSDEVSLEIQGPKIQHYLSQWGKIKNHYKRGLHSEKIFQHLLRTAVEDLEQTGQLTLGLDDFIAATASEHETNMYLLQQALKPVRQNPRRNNPIDTIPEDDLFTLTYYLRDEYSETFEENLETLLSKYGVGSFGMNRVMRNVFEHQENLRNIMNRAYSSEINIAEGRRYVTGLINMGLRFASNPRRNSPGKSVIGAFIIGGIIGHSIKK